MLNHNARGQIEFVFYHIKPKLIKINKPNAVISNKLVKYLITQIKIITTN